MLDNSYFVNPVNQRGQTSYTGNTYTIDRWSLWSPNGKLAAAVEDGCVRFWNGDTEDASFGQKFPTGTFDSEKSYTFAYMTTDGIVRVRNNPIERYEWGEAVNIGLNPNETKLMVWAALYEGEYTAETLPPYVPKGYGAELVECLRYYRQSNSDGRLMVDNAWSGAGERFEIPMRIVPTVTIYSTTWVEQAVSSWGGYDSIPANASNVTQTGFDVWSDQKFAVGKRYFYKYTASAEL